MIADIIFYNGDIITVDGECLSETVQAVAIKECKILGVGSETNMIQSYKGENTVMSDLKGKCLMPSFIEPHTHPDFSALCYSWIQVRGNTHRSMKEVYDTLKVAARQTNEGDWIVAFGLDPVYVSDMPGLNKNDLDAITTRHPLAIITQNLHRAIVNSVGLKMAGFNEKSTFGHGFLEKGNDGLLNGNIYEPEPILTLTAAFPKEQKDVQDRQFLDQLKKYNKCGIVTIGCTGLHELEQFYDLTKNDNCPVRLGVYHSSLHQNGVIGQIEEFKELENENFTMLGIKGWQNGSPYSGTMFMRDPYMDTPWTRAMKFPPAPWYGECNYTSERLHASLKPFHEHGFQIAIHTQGDAAIDIALDAYESLLNEQPRQDHRYRLEHCGLITKPQLERARSLGVTISFFVDHIYGYGEALAKDIIGLERASRWTPLKTATDVGVIWTVHSDSPAFPEEMNIMQTMTTALIRFPKRLQRASSEELVLGPEECCQIEDLIKAYTVNAAYQLFMDDKIGSIAVGKLADLVILSENPITAAKKDITALKKVCIEQVFKGGKEVYRKGT